MWPLDNYEFETPAQDLKWNLTVIAYEIWFLSPKPGNPLFDLGPVAFLSMNPDETEANLDTILKSYYNHFRETCLTLGVKLEDLLWDSFEKFEKEAKQVSFYD